MEKLTLKHLLDFGFKREETHPRNNAFYKDAPCGLYSYKRLRVFLGETVVLILQNVPYTQHFPYRVDNEDILRLDNKSKNAIELVEIMKCNGFLAQN
jgi:hypothetical protein